MYLNQKCISWIGPHGLEIVKVKPLQEISVFTLLTHFRVYYNK